VKALLPLCFGSRNADSENERITPLIVSSSKQAKLLILHSPHSYYPSCCWRWVLKKSSKLRGIGSSSRKKHSTYFAPTPTTEFFYSYSFRKNYGSILGIMGNSLVDVLSNINHLHASLLREAHLPDVRTTPKNWFSHSKKLLLGAVPSLKNSPLFHETGMFNQRITLYSMKHSCSRLIVQQLTRNGA